MKRGSIAVFVILFLPLLIYVAFRFIVLPQLRGEKLPVLGPEGHHIPPFTLVSHNGDTFRSDILRGRIVVADFFFTRCPSICPVLTSNMKKIAQMLATKDDVIFLSFTVDPVHDSPEKLMNYRDKYGINDVRWFFLTGEKDSIYNLAVKYFMVAVKEGESPPDFIHTDKFVLLDRMQRIRGYYSGTDTTELFKLYRDILKLLNERERG